MISTLPNVVVVVVVYGSILLGWGCIKRDINMLLLLLLLLLLFTPENNLYQDWVRDCPHHVDCIIS